MAPLIMDIEASGLGRGSYPIEVGVVMPDGETHCMIVRREPEWQHWDEQAQMLHGISRDVLEIHGHDVIDVAVHLNQWLAGQLVYSDAWGNDSSWLGLLFDCAGISQHFKLESLRSLLTDEQAALWHPTKEEVIEGNNFRRHRASNDAVILQQTWLKTAAICGPSEVINSQS